MSNDWPNMVKWTDEGLVPAIARDAQDSTILTVAWMNREVLDMTSSDGMAVLLVEVKTQAVAQGRGVRA
jgi:phosphoribosyl-AMP cyclohydrolase